MGQTVEDVDGSVLEEAQRLLGTASTRDTVNAALREVIRRKMAIALVDEMAGRSSVELEELRAAAWR